jgi:hypothetical protein
MSRLFRCLTLIGILGLCLWASAPQAAHAVQSCDVLSGGPCSPQGATTVCIHTNGRRGSCFCFDGRWICG